MIKNIYCKLFFQLGITNFLNFVIAFFYKEANFRAHKHTHTCKTYRFHMSLQGIS